MAHAAVGHHDDPKRRSVPVALIEELTAAGLWGIEVHHPDHPAFVRDELREAADRLGLVATGGSDFHGEPEHVIGTCTTSEDAFAALEAAARVT